MITAAGFISEYGPIILGFIIGVIVCIGFALKGYDDF